MPNIGKIRFDRLAKTLKVPCEYAPGLSRARCMAYVYLQILDVCKKDDIRTLRELNRKGKVFETVSGICLITMRSSLYAMKPAPQSLQSWFPSRILLIIKPGPGFRRAFFLRTGTACCSEPPALPGNFIRRSLMGNGCGNSENN